MKKFTIAAALLALLVAGCSDGAGYGDPSILKGTDGTGGVLGSVPTTAPPAQTVPTSTPAEDTTTTRQVTTTSQARAAQPYEIKIQADQAGTQFEPRVAQVFAGAPVTWTNTDSVARSVEFSDQSFVSGPIAPGASVTFTPKRAGEFNYSDGTRPYAVGTLRVQSR